MKRLALYLILNILFFPFTIHANEIDSIEINNTRLYYHYIKSNTPSDKLLFFLHGSTRVFKGLEENKPVEISILLEGNRDLLSTFSKKGYDILIPISFNEYNWLENSGLDFIDSLTSLYSKKYESVFVSGFSDGGTGAYKIFYKNLDAYKGLIIFNGYPQHNNNYKSVDYKKCTSKKVIFFSQESDKVVPYEFLLTEYRRQKLINYHTYFFLKKGKHEFIKYSKSDFEECISLFELNEKPYNTEKDSIWIYPPIDGLILNDTIKDTYQFRAKIAKSYGMNKKEYDSKISNSTGIKMGITKIYPLKIANSDLTKNEFLFKTENFGNIHSIELINYLHFNTW